MEAEQESLLLESSLKKEYSLNQHLRFYRAYPVLDMHSNLTICQLQALLSQS